MSDVSRGSLAAALQDLGSDWTDEQGPTYVYGNTSEHLADAILAALPAPEPPPGKMTLPCAFCDSPDPSKWHRVACVEAVEAVRAAQPAPDLDVELLADRLNDLLERYGVAILRPEALGYARALAATLQEARGSGGEP